MDKDIQDKLNNVLKEHRYGDALAYCEELWEKAHTNAHLKAVKGWCFYKTENMEAAEKWLLKAFNQDCTHPEVATLTVSYLMERAKYRDVVTFIQGCVAFHDKNRLM